MKPHEKVAIIGGGPAGVACAIQLKRYGFDPLLIEKEAIGGLVKNAWRLDNYPGYPEGITGPEMAAMLVKHVERFDIRYSIFDVRYSNYVDDHFVLTYNGGQLNCDYLVIASGTRSRFTNPEGSRNIFTEVYPLRDIREKKIAIVGAGDAAFDFALTLADHNKVVIHNRGTQVRCIPALMEIALKHPNVRYLENSHPQLLADYIIFATGREPELSFLSDEMKHMCDRLEQKGLLYVIGDVRNGMVRQTAVAAGDGVRAAMALREKLANEGN